jgi:succinate dehydrogenase / fumarate reductase iron-sulfur subunit
MCSLYINGEAHGPRVTTCQLHMRMFKDAVYITINLSVQLFSSCKDLVVNRSVLIESNMQEDLYL